jgi:BirA family biotin operon repressor/biotin-[acetyl-CoA-carboxylase] ligase
LPKIQTKLSYGPKRIGAALIELQQVDSTNNYATALAHAGMAQPGTAVLAHYQSAGKGQRHKGWSAAPGENITLSLVLQPDAFAGAGFASLSAANAFRFSMAIALGAQRFFARYAGDETFVKWPNDLYWRDRKAGGILIENILSGSSWKWAIAGLGININQTDFEGLALRAVSLRQITGKAWEIKPLALGLCGQIEAALEQLAQDPESVVADYHRVLYKMGEIVRLKKDARVFSARVLGVSAEGRLRVQHAIDEEFAVGEVEWVF